jgi:hypothetical protein
MLEVFELSLYTLEHMGAGAEGISAWERRWNERHCTRR